MKMIILKNLIFVSTLVHKKSRLTIDNLILLTKAALSCQQACLQLPDFWGALFDLKKASAKST